jgi:GTP cyclohydrolase I
MSYSAESQEKREMAARARRLAGSVTAEADREGLIRTAQQLEKEAQELEDQAGGRDANAGRHPSQRQS